ncbi:MAG: hypothetical protein K9N49_05040 [Candidatus Marinimicrobia bacterium]|nr:hypothetical protein [Candidatus Neomarinimicrobiota bacterium]
MTRNAQIRVMRRVGGLCLALLVYPLAFAAADLVAADNADNDPYPEGWNPGDNGGYGFTEWVILDEGSPGSMYTTASIDNDTWSWGLAGTYAVGRGLSNTMSRGAWTFLAAHGDNLADFSGFNLRSATEVGNGFADTELIRFGLRPEDPTGAYVSTNAGADYVFLDCGWLDGTGALIEYRISWDQTGLWTLRINNLDEEITETFSGALGGDGPVAMLGAGVFGATIDEQMTFDDLRVTPEPATLLMWLFGASLMALTRRRGRLPV